MKFFKTFWTLALVGAMLAFSSCTSDDTDTPVAGPSISFSVTSGTSDGDSVAVGEFFEVGITATAGAVPLASVSVEENGTRISDLSRLTFNGSAASGSPALLTGTDKQSLNWTIGIKAHETADETRTYTIKVTDESQLPATVSLDITAIANVTELTGKLLKNQAGPAGQGGINLKTGEQTGTVASDPTSADGHIKDEGIDINQSNATNWKQQISGMNSSELKDGSGVDFAALKTQSQVQAAFDAAGSVIAVTDKLAEGDVILVKNGSDYFAVQITAIVVTDTDNQDYYDLSIKF